MDILCAEETNRKEGSETISLEAEFKLFYHGVDGKRNGVVIILKK